MPICRNRVYTSQLTPEMDGRVVHLLGWVHDVRDLGKIVFVLLRDKEGVVQLTIKAGSVPSEVLEMAKSLSREDVIHVEGIVKKSQIAKLGIEVIPYKIEIISKSDRVVPIDITGKTPADLNTRLKYRVLDLRRVENWAIFRIQHTVLQVIRSFLVDRGFMEVFTPKIIATATEGGANLFRVDYFGKVAYLAQSPQLYKEQLCAVFERVFEIAPAFRAEKHDTNYHLNEFISVDIEMAFADMFDVMELLEDLIVEIYKSVKDKCRRELQVLGIDLRIPEKPFPRFKYSEVIDYLVERGIEVKWGDDLSTYHLKVFSERVGQQPYFIYYWPTALRPFYTKPCDDNPEESESFDLNIEWLEVASGGTRIHDKDLLERRIREQGLDPQSFSSHLQFFKYGMPPHAGWGLGLSRLLMMMLRRKDIREVVLYPRDRYRLEP